MLKATVSGSFHRHMDQIASAVYQLTDSAVRVLSPSDPRVVDAHGDFLFVASDRVRSIRLVQDRHLDSIRCADFLWLVCPDGYVGQSASMEIGFAAGAGIPIYSTGCPSDLTLREYIKVVPSLRDAIRRVEVTPRASRNAGILIDPRASVAKAHATLERIDKELANPIVKFMAAERVHGDLAELKRDLFLPTSLH